jgi:hypothetical protein
MSEATITRAKRRTAAEYEELVDQLLAEMRLLDVSMDEDQAEIDHYRAETARMLAENRIVLDRIRAMG